MKAASPYLNFDGETREAMTFYAKCLDAELQIQSFADAGMGDNPEIANRTVHAKIENGPMILMASDTEPGAQFTKGNNFYICIDCESAEELEKLHSALAEGGRILMAPQDTFWGARFSMLTDRFGVGWMFNFQLAGNPS
jgi:PhnB protein